MKLVKEIAEAAVEFAAERRGDVCACELEPIIAAKLEPVKVALAGLLGCTEGNTIMHTFNDGFMQECRKALALFEDE